MKISSLLILAFVLSACGNVKNNENKINESEKINKEITVQSQTQDSQENKLNVDIKENYLGSDYKGNYVWAGAMNLAWTDLSENVIKEKIKLDTNDKVALEMTDKFNDPIFTKKDLDEASYYIKSGYGQKTIEEINIESKKKFPTKSFDDLDLDLEPQDIISYAYYLKEVQYLTTFEKTNSLMFNGKNVKGFTAQEKQKDNVMIIDYTNDDKFIVKLNLKNDEDELFLAKGFDMSSPVNIIENINKNENHSIGMDDIDTFKAPKISLNMHRDYKEMIGKSLANNDFKTYIIDAMFENIKFNMDEKGARVENEAAILVDVEELSEKNQRILF